MLLILLLWIIGDNKLSLKTNKIKTNDDILNASRSISNSSIGRSIEILSIVTYLAKFQKSNLTKSKKSKLTKSKKSNLP